MGGLSRCDNDDNDRWGTPVTDEQEAGSGEHEAAGEARGRPLPPPGPVFNPTFEPPADQPPPRAPADGYGPAPYGYPPYPLYAAPVRPASGTATTAMVLGIASLAGNVFLCGVALLLGPVAWAVGHKAMREIRASGGALGGEGQAQAGRMMGIIATGLLVLAVAALVVIIALIAQAAHTDSGGYGQDV